LFRSVVFLLPKEKRKNTAKETKACADRKMVRQIIIKNRDSEGYNPIQLRWHSPIFPSPAGKSVEGNGE